MRKIGILIMVTLCAVCMAQARIWTNTEGRTLEAEFVKMEQGLVYLRLAKDRKVRPLKIEMLSDADQDYIREYQKAEEVVEKEKQKEQVLKKREAEWHKSFEDVKTEAEELNMPILLLYTATEWCPACQSLQDRVFRHREFKDFANANLVLLKVDDDLANFTKKNPEVGEKYKPQSYPTMFFITKDLTMLGQMGGYKDAWSTEFYLEKMATIIGK